MSTSNESIISNEHITYGNLDNQIPYYGYPPNYNFQQSADTNIAGFLLEKIMQQEKELNQERKKIEIQIETIKKLLDEKEKLKKDLSFLKDQITHKNKHIDKLYEDNNKLYDDNCDLTNDQNRKRTRNDFETPSVIAPSPKRGKNILCRYYHHPDGKRICKFGDNCDFVHSVKSYGNCFRTIKCQNLWCLNPRECTFKHETEQLKPID